MELVARCVDGHHNGALPACPEVGCGGRLTPLFDLGTVVCGGKFNEERGMFQKCYFKANLKDIKNRLPWRSHKPSAEEAERDRTTRRGTGAGVVDVSDVESLFAGIDVSSAEGRKSLVALLCDVGRKKAINLPASQAEASYVSLMPVLLPVHNNYSALYYLRSTFNLSHKVAPINGQSPLLPNRSLYLYFLLRLALVSARSVSVTMLSSNGTTLCMSII